MKISSKGRYAVEIMVDIARNNNNFNSVNEIANRQKISVKYLEQIISKLVKAELLISSRGKTGGYILKKPASDYSLAEILTVTGDMPKLSPCLTSPSTCPKKDSCVAIGCWMTLDKMMTDYLSSITLQNLIDKTYTLDKISNKNK